MNIQVAVPTLETVEKLLLVCFFKMINVLFEFISTISLQHDLV